MQLEGSCHCGKVQFRLLSAHPYPYQRCYCSICRKTQGGGGYAINVSGDARTLRVTGKQHISIYHAKLRGGPGERTRTSSAERHFCSLCGSALWLFSPEWPDLVHPFASAVDTALPTPPEHTHMMLAFKAPWVEVRATPHDTRVQTYPDESIADWHQRLTLAEPG